MFLSKTDYRLWILATFIDHFFRNSRVGRENFVSETLFHISAQRRWYICFSLLLKTTYNVTVSIGTSNVHIYRFSPQIQQFWKSVILLIIRKIVLYFIGKLIIYSYNGNQFFAYHKCKYSCWWRHILLQLRDYDVILIMRSDICLPQMQVFMITFWCILINGLRKYWNRPLI